MKIPELMNRDELSRTLWGFRYEFMVAGFFSMVANLLMLTPTIYMLQVYDRVMLSQSTGTLIAVSFITLFFFGVLTFAEWMRSRLLVSSGVRLDELLSKRLVRRDGHLFWCGASGAGLVGEQRHQTCASRSQQGPARCGWLLAKQVSQRRSD